MNNIISWMKCFEKEGIWSAERKEIILSYHIKINVFVKLLLITNYHERSLYSDLTGGMNSYNNIFKYNMRELSIQSNMVNCCNRKEI